MKDYFNLGEEYMFYNNILISGVIIIAVIALLLFVLDYYISHNFRLRLYLGNFFKSILKNKIFTILLLATLIFVFIFISLMIKTFNGGEWKFSYSTLISKKIGDWGDFATCLGAIFALISILLAYRAFMSQVNASKRTSFDATFTQIFAQHHVLHDKVLKHDIAFISRYDLSYVVNDINNNIFAICRNEFMKYRPVFDTILDSEFWNCLERATQKRISDNVKTTIINRINIRQFWRCFNRIIGLEASINFKNYFKYIYHEINIVVNQPDEVLNDNAKRNYIQLIQAQMNYDELFCYFINQVEYLYYWRTHKTINEATYDEAITHAQNLLEYGFFYELCKSRSGHVNLVRDISRYNNEEVSRLIDVNWIS